MVSTFSRRAFIAMSVGTTATCFIQSAVAASLHMPRGKPILRIGGRIDVHNSRNEAHFDIAMLDRLGTRSFATTTPWTDGLSTWEGVPLSTLMESVGASGDLLRVTALNDYVADVPLEGLAEDGAILAMRRDGELMPIRDKGPLFILYPFDGNPRLQQQSVYMRCAWQIARLDVL